MKGSELIKEVQEIIDEFGDLDVGIENQEFSCFGCVSQIYFKKAETEGASYNQDDVSDEAYFIAIE